MLHDRQWLQDATGELLEEAPAPENTDMQEALRGSLDLSQQAQPSSESAVREGGAFADADFRETVSRALDTGMAEPADSKPAQQVCTPSAVHAETPCRPVLPVGSQRDKKKNSEQRCCTCSPVACVSLRGVQTHCGHPCSAHQELNQTLCLEE